MFEIERRELFAALREKAHHITEKYILLSDHHSKEGVPAENRIKWFIDV